MDYTAYPVLNTSYRAATIDTLGLHSLNPPNLNLRLLHIPIKRPLPIQTNLGWCPNTGSRPPRLQQLQPRQWRLPSKEPTLDL